VDETHTQSVDGKFLDPGRNSDRCAVRQNGLGKLMLFQRYGLSRNNAREAYFNDREFAFDK
jgi:hypothetical protein